MATATHYIDAIQAIDSRQQYWQRNAGLWMLVVILCLICVFSLNQIGYQRGFARITDDAKRHATEELALQIQILESHLEKYRLLPVLMARHGEKLPAQGTEQTRTWLKQLAYLTGAYDVAVLNTQGGVEISALKTSKTAYPALEQTALVAAPREARLGRQYLYLNSETQLYGFSTALKTPQNEDKFLVFFVDLADVFESWSLSGTEILAYDDNDLVTLASQQTWIGQLRTGVDRFATNTHYAQATVDLATMGWHVVAYQKMEPGTLVQQIVLTSALLCLSIIIFFALFIRRRELQVKAILRDRLYNAELERQISFRTAELQSANEHLTEEVTERRHTELQLKTTQKELIHAAKLATIGQMSTTLSHEYNQPLATMRTYAENSLKFLQQNKTAPVVDNLQRIIEQTNRLGNLSKTLMSFARKPDDELSKVNLSACINEAIMLVQPRIKQTAMVIDNRVPESVMILGRTVQVSQILLNLLSNAIDAINDNPTPTAPPLVLISADVGSQHTTFRIEDSGPGIDKAKLDTIFDPFVTTKISGQGLGLGLSVVKDIIHEHQGSLTVGESTLGGACFAITLPSWPTHSGGLHDAKS